MATNTNEDTGTTSSATSCWTQEPITNLNTGIETLDFVLNGRIKNKGKTYDAISSVGCKKKKWKTVVTNVYRPEGGQSPRNKDSDTVKCTAAKKKKRR